MTVLLFTTGRKTREAKAQVEYDNASAALRTRIKAAEGAQWDLRLAAAVLRGEEVRLRLRHAGAGAVAVVTPNLSASEPG